MQRQLIPSKSQSRQLTIDHQLRNKIRPCMIQQIKRITKNNTNKVNFSQLLQQSQSHRKKRTEGNHESSRYQDHNRNNAETIDRIHSESRSQYLIHTIQPHSSSNSATKSYPHMIQQTFDTSQRKTTPPQIRSSTHNTINNAHNRSQRNTAIRKLYRNDKIRDSLHHTTRSKNGKKQWKKIQNGNGNRSIAWRREKIEFVHLRRSGWEGMAAGGDRRGKGFAGAAKRVRRRWGMENGSWREIFYRREMVACNKYN